MEWKEDKPLKFQGQEWLCTNWNISHKADRFIELHMDLVRGFAIHQPEPKEEQDMNRSTTVFLVDNTVKALRARYEDGGKEELFKTFDATIKKDDLLVVESPARWGFSVVKVIDPDVTVDIDDPTTVVKWVVSKVDLTDHKVILEQETAAIEKVRVAEFNKKKRDLIANMASPEDAEALKSIHINPALTDQTKPGGVVGNKAAD